MSVKIEISTGELLDKITILRIKSERMDDPDKLENVHRELAVLEQAWRDCAMASEEIDQAIDGLKAINEKLWEIEDAIRDKERHGVFDQAFIDLARAVYFSNDERAAIKKRINLLTHSGLVEEKSYSDYRSG